MPVRPHPSVENPSLPFPRDSDRNQEVGRRETLNIDWGTAKDRAKPQNILNICRALHVYLNPSGWYSDWHAPMARMENALNGYRTGHHLYYRGGRNGLDRAPHLPL